MSEFRVVPARQGLHWLREGSRSFFQQPLPLGSLFFLSSMALMLIMAFPLIGPPLALMLTPCVCFGLLASVGEVRAKRFPSPKLLIEGIRGPALRRRNMMRMGLIYAGLMLLLAVLCLSGIDMSGIAKPDGTVDLAALQGRSDIRRAVLIMSVCSVPITVVFTHATALMYWNQATPLPSLRLSFSAFVRNLGAFALLLVMLLAAMLAISNLLAWLLYAVGLGAFIMAMMFPISAAITCVGMGGLFQAFLDLHPPTTPAPAQDEWPASP